MSNVYRGLKRTSIVYPPSHKSRGLPVVECVKHLCYGAMSPQNEADNRVEAVSEDGYFDGIRGLPVGIHRVSTSYKMIFADLFEGNTLMNTDRFLLRA